MTFGDVATIMQSSYFGQFSGDPAIEFRILKILVRNKLCGHILLALPIASSVDIHSEYSWEVRLSSEIVDAQICQIALSPIPEVCEHFARVDTELFPDQKDWSRGGLEYAWLDINRDGKLDLILRVRNFEWCGSVGCANYIFLSELASDGSASYETATILPISLEPIFVFDRGGLGIALRFGASDFFVDPVALYRSGKNEYRIED